MIEFSLCNILRLSKIIVIILSFAYSSNSDEEKREGRVKAAAEFRLERRQLSYRFVSGAYLTQVIGERLEKSFSDLRSCVTKNRHLESPVLNTEAGRLTKIP